MINRIADHKIRAFDSLKETVAELGKDALLHSRISSQSPPTGSRNTHKNRKTFCSRFDFEYR